MSHLAETSFRWQEKVNLIQLFPNKSKINTIFYFIYFVLIVLPFEDKMQKCQLNIIGKMCCNLSRHCITCKKSMFYLDFSKKWLLFGSFYRVIPDIQEFEYNAIFYVVSVRSITLWIFEQVHMLLPHIFQVIISYCIRQMNFTRKRLYN